MKMNERMKNKYTCNIKCKKKKVRFSGRCLKTRFRRVWLIFSNLKLFFDQKCCQTGFVQGSFNNFLQVVLVKSRGLEFVFLDALDRCDHQIFVIRILVAL